MMNDPLRRKMFREAGMSKQPMGILASSPELINATQSPGYSHGGLHKANWMNNDNIYSPNLTTYKNKALSVGKDVIGTETPPTKSELEQLAEMKRQETIKDLQLVPDGSAPNFGVDTSLETTLPLTNKINETNTSILKNEDLTYPTNKSKSKRGDTSNTDLTSENNNNEPKSPTTAATLYGFDMESKVKEERDKIALAMTKYNEGVAESGDMEFLGTSLNKELETQIKLLREEDKPFTIAEATKKFKELGYKDDETLTKDYNEDKEASFWLNLMKAGMAIAAGESPNALTNMAKGFSLGLQGYGEDTGQLRKELRADKKEASRIMFDLVKDGKSERLATKALSLQKSAAITNILTTKVGEERDRLLAEVNNETANRKLTISLYKSFADMNLEAKKWDLNSEQYTESVKMAYAKMMNDDLKLLQAAGQITVIDPNQPLTPENIRSTPEGTKNIQLLIENLKTGKSGKITDSRYEQGTAAAKGITASGIVLKLPGKEDYNARDAGDAIKRYNEDRQDKVLSAGSENVMIAGEDIRFAKVNGGKIDFSMQTDRMKEIYKKKPADGTQSLFEKNIDLFININ
jgi:hypothetical protein